MLSPHASRRPVALLMHDLFFLSAVTSAATTAAVPVIVVKPGEEIPELSSLAVVDLLYPGDWEASVREFTLNQGGYVIGFGPHVDGELMKRARIAGCTKVMARSKFAVEIPNIMRLAARLPEGRRLL